MHTFLGKKVLTDRGHEYFRFKFQQTGRNQTAGFLDWDSERFSKRWLSVTSFLGTFALSLKLPSYLLD